MEIAVCSSTSFIRTREEKLGSCDFPKFSSFAPVLKGREFDRRLKLRLVSFM